MEKNLNHDTFKLKHKLQKSMTMLLTTKIYSWKNNHSSFVRMAQESTGKEFCLIVCLNVFNYIYSNKFCMSLI